MLRLLGLGLRGRMAVVGVEQVRHAAMAGKLRLAVVAPDASRHSLEKVVPLLTARGIEMIEAPSASELGRIAGYETTAVIGVVDSRLAKGIRDAGSEGATGRMVE